LGIIWFLGLKIVREIEIEVKIEVEIEVESENESYGEIVNGSESEILIDILSESF